MVLHLEEKRVFAKNFLKFLNKFTCLHVISRQYRLRDVSAYTSRQADKPIAIFFKHFKIYPRLVIEPFQMRQGNQLHQVFIALLVLRQKNQMAVSGGIILNADITCNISLASDNRFDSGGFEFLIKLNRAIHNSMIGNSHRWKRKLLAKINVLVNFGEPV